MELIIRILAHQTMHPNMGKRDIIHNFYLIQYSLKLYAHDAIVVMSNMCYKTTRMLCLYFVLSIHSFKTWACSLEETQVYIQSTSALHQQRLISTRLLCSYNLYIYEYLIVLTHAFCTENPYYVLARIQINRFFLYVQLGELLTQQTVKM